jgi:hypothetical protein
LWNAVLGGQVPCYSSLRSYLGPPAVPVAPTAPSAASSTSSETPTSAIINIVFAIQYVVQPAAPSLSTGAEAGIGVGAGVAGIAIIVLALLLVWRTRKHKKDKAALTAIPANGQNSTRQEYQQGSISPTSPYSLSRRPELPSDETTHPVPVEAPPQGQVGCFLYQQPQPQIQDPLPPNAYATLHYRQAEPPPQGRGAPASAPVISTASGTEGFGSVGAQFHRKPLPFSFVGQTGFGYHQLYQQQTQELDAQTPPREMR